jgi:hypothetical protein
MTADEQAQPSGEGASSDDTQDPSVAPETAPTLNRAQRRAMAQGKKSAGGNSTLPNAQQRGFGGSSAAKGGQARFPRTGHK